ncbi:MAG: hypothetical protein IJ845_09170 [Bacteroidaceae bacterium]|nr:hypothetical protein [Bacteroidaceae bacterium]
MRATIHTLFMLSLLSGLVSCGDDVLIEPAESVLSESGSYIREITVTMPEIQAGDGFSDTRVTYDFSTGKHPWTVGDTLGIFPSVGGQVEFAIDENTAGGTSASFDGGGWALKKSSKYAAYFPYSKRNVYTSNKAIPMDYTGQVQTGNESTAHLASYDYLASGSITSSSDGKLNFPLSRLGSFLRLRFDAPFSDTYTSIELFSSTTPFVTKAELDVSGTSPKVTVKEKSYVIRLELQDVTLTKGTRLTAWMMAYPVALASGGGTLRVVLHGKKGDYEADLTPQNLTANNPFAFTATLTGAKLKNATLIANAEQYNGISLTRDANGYVDVKANNELLAQVKTIKVGVGNDPTICDEIGFFPNLENLTCTTNTQQEKIIALDVSKNKKLVSLVCPGHNLTSLDLSNNMNLKVLNISGNSISNIDLSNNPVLEELVCSGQKVDFTTLDLTNNINLKTVECISNKIESLDLSNNVNLEKLNCRSNPLLTSLDLSNHKALKTLICYGSSSSVGKLASLDLTNCTALTDIQCQYNNLSNLDLSTNTALLTLDCSHNKILTLDVSNNKALKTLNCSYNSLSRLSISTKELTNLTTLHVSYCTSLRYLECASPITDYKNGAGSLSTLNFTGCTNLVTLNCSGNKIASLSLSSAFKDLSNLNCAGNILTSLDVSSVTKLERLDCYANLLSKLDITKCTSLKLYGGNSSSRSWVYCGSQWSNANKTTEKNLTLSITSSNSGSLQDTGTFNKNVTVTTVTQ